MKKVNNFQEEFSVQDIEIVRDITATHDCGMSRIALKAPEQIYRIHRSLMKGPDSASATILATTLKLHYAIQVWCKAALISAHKTNKMFHYWQIYWKSSDGPFNRLEYQDFDQNITIEQLLQWFWDLLEIIADSGEIKVSEGYHIDCEGVEYEGPNVLCKLILDAETGQEIVQKVTDVFTHPYNKMPKTFKWKEIKDFFYEMSLDQMRLTMPEKLHNHSALDDVLLTACSEWDVEKIKLSINRGANINCLNQCGDSVLRMAVDMYKDHNMLPDKKYTEEETKKIESENEKKCKEIIELLLSYGADINLFGFNGEPPLMWIFCEKSPEMTKFLLERGASPNVNCDLTNSEDWPVHKNVRSSVLYAIDHFLYGYYNYKDYEIETIIREAGGRMYVWGFNPWNYENIDKYIVHMVPSHIYDDKMFNDNSGWKIGTSEQLTIEDKNGNQTIIELNGFQDLKQWNNEFMQNRANYKFDWNSWKEKGYRIACNVAMMLPEDVALYYLYQNNQIVEKYPCFGNLYICCDGEPIRIK